jgi:hypothetical protein
MKFIDFILGKFKREKEEVLIKEKKKISKDQIEEDCEKELFLFLKEKSGGKLGIPTE